MSAVHVDPALSVEAWRIFCELLSIDEAAREAALRSLASRDAALHTRVGELLQGDRRAQGAASRALGCGAALAVQPGDPGAAMPASAQATSFEGRCGARVGPYELLAPLGRGG